MSEYDRGDNGYDDRGETQCGHKLHLSNFTLKSLSDLWSHVRASSGTTIITHLYSKGQRVCSPHLYWEWLKKVYYHEYP